jgi:hypothetical protein
MSVLALIISFLAGIGVFGIRRGNSWRAAFLQSAIVHSSILVIATEILSLSHNIVPAAIQALWILSASIHIVALGLGLRRRGLSRDRFTSLQQTSRLEKFALVGIIAILAICGITAFIAPPNNYDSMTYHMVRVMHWIQNKSVAHYPTQNLRQIAFPPGANYILLHLQLLTGSDRLANLVQWIAFVGSILGASLIAKIVAGPQTQIVAALVCASLPMAIMQSTTTQNDLLTGFWLLCAVYFIVRTDNYQMRDFIWITLSLSLTVITKPTGIIFGLPLVLWVNARYLFQKDRFSWRLLPQLFTINSGILVGVISLSIPHFVRNFYVFGNPLVELGTRNELLGTETIASNLLRMICLNLPFQPIWEATEKLHEILGWDIANPKTTYLSRMYPFFPETAWNFLLPNDGAVGSPTHLIFFFAALVSVTRQYCIQLDEYRKKLKSTIPPLTFQLALTIGLAAILYCLLVKWQIWTNRLILPVFILSTPVIASYLRYKTSNNMRWLVVSLLLGSGIFYSLTPIHHPIIAFPIKSTQLSQSPSIMTLSREEMYLSGNGRSLYKPFIQSAQSAADKGCDTIGLISGDGSIEYPLWVYLENRLKHPIRMKHINVKNESANSEPEFPDNQICMTIKVSR